jgi:hypothetical protein
MGILALTADERVVAVKFTKDSLSVSPRDGRKPVRLGFVKTCGLLELLFLMTVIGCNQGLEPPMSTPKIDQTIEDFAMQDDLDLMIRFGTEEPLVEFPAESLTVSVPLTPVGVGLYRVEGVPFGIESANYGDVIEAEPTENEWLRFIRVAEAGGWRTFDYILPPHKINGESGQSLLRELEARGGHWECIFGGLLLVCIPPGLDLDPDAWVDSL